jgi:hypothetical protein
LFDRHQISPQLRDIEYKYICVFLNSRPQLWGAKHPCRIDLT